MIANTDYKARGLNLLNPHLDFRTDLGEDLRRTFRKRVKEAAKPLQEAYTILKEIRRGKYALCKPPMPPRGLVASDFNRVVPPRPDLRPPPVTLVGADRDRAVRNAFAAELGHVFTSAA